ncbi:C2 domain-containing protein [Blakeslea trispora]|nr:C2 domain-containing protein [Blakeslea trispora]
MSDPVKVKESDQLFKAVNTTLKAEEGAPVHVFDNPDISAEEKKAELMDHASSVPSAPQLDPNKAIDQDVLNDSKAGWTAFSNLPNPGDEQAMYDFAQHRSPDEIKQSYNDRARTSNGEFNDDLVAQLIPIHLLGEWYHNCGVVFVAIFFTWLLTKLRFGLMSCFVVGAFFATYYRTSIKRTRRNARDDMQRQVALNKLESDSETVDWMNHFLDRFWLIFEPVLSAQVIGQVDAILSENTPSFLDSIRLSSFTLGTKAPRINSIKTYPGSDPDVVCMDWSFSFMPNDILDLTAREVQSKVNPKIVLTIRVGKGMMGAGIPILLEDIAFSGNMRIKLKLFNEMPHVKTAEICFLQKPHFDYVLKPVGGETFGFDINNIPGLETFVKDQVHSNLGPMMYAPNVFTLDVAAMMAGTDLDAAIGVLAITIYSASGLKPNDIFGTLDPYCLFHIDNVHNPELARTSTIENNNNPKWNETHFLLLKNFNGTLLLKIMDRNTGRNDVEIGVANFDLKELEESQNAIEGLNLIVYRSGKPVGEIKADSHFFPVSKPEKNETDGTIIPAAESNSGVLRFYIQECKDIGGAIKQKKGGVPLVGGIPVVNKVPIIGQGSQSVNTYAIFKVNGQTKLRTATFKRSINPRWNKYVEVFVSNKTETNLEVTLMNAVEFGEDSVIGGWNSSMNDMEKQLSDHNDWWSIKEGTGKIHLNMTWKPIPMTGFNASLTKGQYQRPIGVVRVQLNKATKLKNVEALTGGKSDPYVRVMSGLQSRAQTEAILDNLNPVWDTAVYVPIHSIREDLMLEVMDYNDIQKDKLLGMCDLFIKDLVVEKKLEDGSVIYEPLPAVKRNVALLNNSRKIGRGQLDYEASFFPTLTMLKLPEEKNDDLKETEAQNPSSELATMNVHSHPTSDLNGEPVHYTSDHQINLLAYSAGILSVKIGRVSLTQKTKAVVEMLLDSNEAQYRTTSAKGTALTFDEFGDAFVKEMDLSRVVIRVRDAKDDYKDEDHIGFWSSTVQDIVKNVMQGQKEQEYRLLDCTGGVIFLTFNYIPVVKFVLDPNESLENQGNLSVALISASGLRAADKSGTSDPYCVFTVNNEKVYKSQTYKKQLAPVFEKSEVFTVPIMARRKAVLEVRIYDWDQIGHNELLAEGPVPIADLESFAAQEMDVALRGGSIRLRLKWEPQLLARRREGTSLLGSTTKLFSSGTGMAGDMVGAGGKVISGGTKIVGGGTKIVGGAIGGGIGAIGRGFNKFGGSHHKRASLTSDESAAGDRHASIDHGRSNRASLDPSSTELGARPKSMIEDGETSMDKKNSHKNKNSSLEFMMRGYNKLADRDVEKILFTIANHIDEDQSFDRRLLLTPSGTEELHIQSQVV